MNILETYVKLLNENTSKSRQILFLKAFTNIMDFIGKDHYLINFKSMRRMWYEDDVLEVDDKPILKDTDKHYLLYDRNLMTEIKLPKTNSETFCKICSPFNSFIDPYEYFYNLDNADYRAFVSDFTEWLDKLWTAAKKLEVKGEKPSPTSEQVQKIGTLFDITFF